MRSSVNRSVGFCGVLTTAPRGVLLSFKSLEGVAGSGVAHLLLIFIVVGLLLSAPQLGAAGTNHWAFKPIKDPVPPMSEDPELRAWAANPIDWFIAQRLEKRQLRPAIASDPRRLIRRVTLDLTGLPPTADEVDAFARDHSSAAYAQVVDRLLASPRYGERWGRHWLDVARYADSNGMDENLAYASAYRYRDYVIDSFNRDQPFDEFLREQIAGDLWLKDGRRRRQPEAVSATGFLCVGPKMLAEDDPVKMQMDIIDEQVDTLGRTFMGLSIGCARCHDHKYDPISTRDYYALAGIFRSTTTMENHKVVARWQEKFVAPAAEIEALNEARARADSKKRDVDGLVDQSNRELRRVYLGWTAQALLVSRESNLILEHAASRVSKQTPEAAVHEVESIRIEAESFHRGNQVSKTDTGYGEGIGVIYGNGGVTNAVEYDWTAPAEGRYLLAVRYAAQEARPVRCFLDGRQVLAAVASKATGGWNPPQQQWFHEGDLVVDAGRHTLRFERSDCFPHIDQILLAPRHIGWPEKVPRETTSAPTERSELFAAFSKRLGEVALKASAETNSIWAAWNRLTSATNRVASTNAVARRLGLGIDSPMALAWRYQDLFEAADQAWETLRNSPEGKKASSLGDPVDEVFRKELANAKGGFAIPEGSERFYREPQRQALANARTELEQLQKKIPLLPEAMAVSEGQSTHLAVHIRGSHLRLGEMTERGFLSSFAQVPAGEIDPKTSGRKELTDWLTHPDHPLTTRVLVNRLWHHHFGAGLVRTTDDFGIMGEPPSHPELLDWLATRFIESHWSIKAMHRLILQSSTYQQSVEPSRTEGGLSRSDPTLVDPDNRMLWHMNRRRLEAEAVRDGILAVSGGLDFSTGGSLLPTRNREYVTGAGSSIDKTMFRSSRRAVYLPVVRSSLDDFMQTFDFPDPSVANGRRDQTIIPSQALFMMNSDLVASACRSLAQQAVYKEVNEDPKCIRTVFRRIHARSPTDTE